MKSFFLCFCGCRKPAKEPTPRGAHDPRGSRKITSLRTCKHSIHEEKCCGQKMQRHKVLKKKSLPKKNISGRCGLRWPVGMRGECHPRAPSAAVPCAFFKQLPSLPNCTESASSSIHIVNVWLIQENRRRRAC